MNCRNCGNSLPTNSSFCPNCGSAVAMAQPTQAMAQPQTDSSQNIYQQPDYNSQNMYQQLVDNTQSVYHQPINNTQNMYQQSYNQFSPIQKKSKAPWIALGVSIFLVIGIIVLIVMLLISDKPDQSSPADVINSYLEAISDNDADNYLDTVYPVTLTYYTLAGYSKDDVFTYIREEILDEFSATNVSFSDIKITEKEALDTDFIEEVNNELTSMPGFITMTSGHKLSGTVVITTNNSTVTCEWEATVVLADDNYYVLEFYFDYY